MKTLLFGGRGYLGRQILERHPDAVSSPADIADQAAVAAELERHRPDVVINAAGKTGVPNVDWCEDHKLETIRSNVTGPLVLLEECAKRSLYWVQLGSGCIYQGDNGGRGFTEEDVPNFLGSFYARTKAWVDQMLKEFPNVLLLRLRMPFDGTSERRNLVQKLIKYERVLDVQNSITYIPDFLDVLDTLVAKKATGIFNVVNEGDHFPYQIVEMYKKFVQPDHSFERLTLNDLSDVVKAGRSNCVLSTAKLQSVGVSLPPVQRRLEEAMQMLSAREN